MPSFAKLFAFATCVAVAFAGHCPDAKVVHESTIPTASGGVVKVTGFSCAAKKVTSRDSMLKRTTINECGEICTNSCSDEAGSLPPVSDDCNEIREAVQIQQANIPPTFTVGAYGAFSLTFQTCTMTFQSYSSDSLTYCFMDLVNEANQAGAACFPPVLPFSSAGICTSLDGLFTATAAHS